MRQLKRSDGFTLVEAMAAVTVVAVSLIGIYQAFGYGQAFVEKSGIRRQAIVLINSEMELMRDQHLREPQRFRKMQSGVQKSTVVTLWKERGIEAESKTEILPVNKESELHFRDVNVTLQYASAWIADTIVLGTRMYFAR